MTWTLVWISSALIFNLCIYWIYEYQLVENPLTNGKEAATLFFTGYVIEKSLSLDNIFVIALIFSYFSVPPKFQHRVLLWGVLGAIFMRLFMIFAGITLLNEFAWMNYIFGILLMGTAVRMLFVKEEKLRPEKNFLVILVKKFLPVTSNYRGKAFFVREHGKLWMTPLFLALIVVETSDALFAIDSIPAIFAITTDPFIVFTSNIFAILGLRSLYFVLATAIKRFYYLRFSMVFLLGFVGFKMFFSHHYPIGTMTSLFIILGILTLGVLASLFTKEAHMRAWVFPIYHQFKEIAIVTVKDIKRIAILLLGIIILIMGLAMLVLPGPGLIFIPIGLMLLAKEFLWARKLLKKLKSSKKTMEHLLGSNNKEKGDIANKK